MTKTLPVLSFAKLDQGMPMPHLLDIQTRAFQSLLQPDGKGAERTDVGLERVFKDVFPIQDVNGNYSLEFVKYGLGEPKYTVEECIERDMTYSVPLKATLQLVVMEEVGETTKTKRPKNIIEKEVYLGELPILTPLGTFVINGAERVIVSQLHRSPGVVGRVHNRHPRRDLRPYRQEEEVPGQRSAARLRVWDQRRHPVALLRDQGARHHGQARGPRPEARSPRHPAGDGRPRPREQEGRAVGPRGRRADAREVQYLPSGRHPQGEGVRGVHRARPAGRGAADHHAATARQAPPRLRRRRPGDGGGAGRGRPRALRHPEEA